MFHRDFNGFVGNTNIEASVLRFNHLYKFKDNNELISSYVMKSGEISGHHANTLTSHSLSFNYKYQLKKRYHLNGLLGVESYSTKADGKSKSKILPLIAINANLDF